jgi:phosphoribosylformylglycinamidine synthase
MIEAEIFVNLKKTVADPQGFTIKHALESLGYDKVGEVRIGKLVDIKLNTDDKEWAEKMLKEMCEKLLANPVIEEYSFKLKS